MQMREEDHTFNEKLAQMSLVTNPCLAELCLCNLLQSEARRRFIIHCSFKITGGCDSGIVQFHVGIRGGERNACSWMRDTDRSVRFNLYCRQ